MYSGDLNIFKILLSFALFLVVEHGVRAQNDPYKFSHLDITDGLSDNQVNCIFKDREGFMWFGTISSTSPMLPRPYPLFEPKMPVKSKIERTAGFSVIVGSGRGVRRSCSCACSR